MIEHIPTEKGVMVRVVIDHDDPNRRDGDAVTTGPLGLAFEDKRQAEALVARYFAEHARRHRTVVILPYQLADRTLYAVIANFRYGSKGASANTRWLQGQIDAIAALYTGVEALPFEARLA